MQTANETVTRICELNETISAHSFHNIAIMEVSLEIVYLYMFVIFNAVEIVINRYLTYTPYCCFAARR